MTFKKPYIIGIAGGSGAGKTLVLKTLRKHFDTNALCIISQDNYYRPAGEQVIDENGHINFDRPEGIDIEGFLKDIDALSKGGAVVHQEYMFNQPGINGKEITLIPAPIIIIEGLFIFHFPQIRDILDLKVFLDSEGQTRLKRRLERDHKERGASKETILYQWENHVIPAYEKFLLPYRLDADLVIDNNGSIDKAINELVVVMKDKKKQLQ